MKGKGVSLESISGITGRVLKCLHEKGIESAEDLLAKAKALEGTPGGLSRLLGMDEAELEDVLESARGVVSEAFLKVLDEPYDYTRFRFGALPPEEMLEPDTEGAEREESMSHRADSGASQEEDE